MRICVVLILWCTRGVAWGSFNFIWVVNFYLSLRNPFRSTKGFTKLYHGFVWVMALLGVGLIWAGILHRCTRALSYARDMIYSLLTGNNTDFASTADLTCWVHIDQPAAWYLDWLLIIFSLFAIASLVYCYWRINAGKDHSFKRTTEKGTRNALVNFTKV